MKKGSLFRLCVSMTFLLALFPNTVSQAAQEQEASWTLTSQMGGTSQAIAISDQTLFLGVGLHVEVFDIGDPGELKLIGSSAILPNFIEGLFISDYLYAACGEDGLQILDISNLDSPQIVGAFNTPGYTEDVIIHENHAILADGPNGIQILDISDPTNPVWVSEAYPLAYTYAVEMSGSTLYAAGGGSGLLTVDVSNFDQPLEKGILSTSGFLYSLVVKDNLVYTANAWGGIGMVDISDPLTPSLLEAIPTDGWVMDVVIQNSNLLAMDGTDGVRFYTLAGQFPQLLGIYTATGFTFQGVLDGKTAYVTDKENGLLLLDFNDTGNPTLVTRYLPILDARRATMSEDTAYVAAGLSGMRAIDVSNPNQPQETFWFDTETGYANKVLVEGNLAYLSTHLATAYPLRIFDISDSRHPELIGQVENNEAVFNTAFRSLAYSNETIYVPGENFDVAVDAQDPSNPQVLGLIPFPNPINAAAQGNLLITVNNNQLQMVDISEPAAMKEITTFERLSEGEAIIFLDENTVLTSSEFGMAVVDVSDPSSPALLSSVAVPGTVMEIFIDGSTVYLSCLGAGIQIVDLSDLNEPKLIETVNTPGMAYDSYVKGNTMLVADSMGGLLIYQRDIVANAEKTAALSPLTVSYPTHSDTTDSMEDASAQNNRQEQMNNPDQTALTCIVSTTADDGDGSLRECLITLKEGSTITFDTQVFSPTDPTSIFVSSPLPVVYQTPFSIDASNAGVVLDGSQLESGNGLEFYASNCVIKGLQIMNFPQDGIHANGDNNIIGGNRLIGTGPTGEGNLISGNGRNGINLSGKNDIVRGNLVGTDSTGTDAIPNYYGVFVSDWNDGAIIGGTVEGEGNIISGNTWANLDSWGNHTHIIGNLFGLDITGTKAVDPQTAANIIIESGASNVVIGGTQPEMRNVVSGSDLGIVLSDPNTYQTSVIGNYIGTDISGTISIPNNTGFTIFTVSYNRIGGAGEGEGNLISGNQTGINLNGYGVSDNIILANTIGWDASGNKQLPNNTGVSINMGQKHNIIGGYTTGEGNRISAIDMGMRISDPGNEYNYLASNIISECNVAAIYFENHSSHNFIQNNTLTDMSSDGMRVDYGSGNQMRANTFFMRPENAILLVENGNLNLAAPQITSATTYHISGETCSECWVEFYAIGDSAITYLGKVNAGTNGVFEWESCNALEASQIAALCIDQQGNTSPFSQSVSLTNDESSSPANCSPSP